ncbi:MAG: PLDc N-terminal domain-containing protein [Candidatus Methanomethylophilaceae archaeon]|nr:PLDc N-terminal domain-containing protein [Candidatus Methanomethylophilaceae archaeon]
MSAVSTFMSVVDFFADILLLLVILDVIAVIALMFMERCDPRSFFAWIIVLLFVPPVGFILYLYMGRTVYWHTGAYNDPGFWRSSLEGSREALEDDMENY